jgi:hypothetical protein
MRRIALVMAALMLAFTVSACGKEAAPTTTSASFSCPTDNTKSFAKTRFVADVGLAFGTFHHWIWKPYRAGTFKKGADGRTFALVKAVGAAALVTHLIGNAADNVKASPGLCNAIGQPMAKLNDLVSNLGSALRHGDFSTLTGIAGAVGTLSSLMAQHGAPVRESYHQ